jgi:hypothetical protein
MMSKHKLQEGEVVFDLGEFLPHGRSFWWSSEVDDMIAALHEHMPAHVGTIMTEESARSHVRYQVLHVTLSGGASEEEFRLKAAWVISHHKAHVLPRAARPHKAAS